MQARHILPVLAVTLGLVWSTAALAQMSADDAPVLPDPAPHPSHVLPPSLATADVAVVTPTVPPPHRKTNACTALNPCAVVAAQN